MVRANPTTVVVGAGPYGLSVAAHLRAHRLPVLLFGRPMELWRRMPAGMCLKSSWSASSLSDPARAYSLDRYVAVTGRRRQDPIPLGFFCEYARWFQERAVPPVDEAWVTCLRRAPDGFHLDLADGRTVEAGRVVIAVGISRFAWVPAFASQLPPGMASHTSECVDLGAHRDREVAVVGAGRGARAAHRAWTGDLGRSSPLPDAPAAPGPPLRPQRRGARRREPPGRPTAAGAAIAGPPATRLDRSLGAARGAEASAEP